MRGKFQASQRKRTEAQGGEGTSEQQLTHLTPHTPVCLAEMQIYERERKGGRKSGRRAAINSSVFA